jgi:glycerol uptake facilitator-like aquaporin
MSSIIPYFSSFLTEFIGTFIFIVVILSIGEPVSMAITFLAAIYFGSKFIDAVSMNPAVSVVYWIRGNINWINFLIYVVAELLAAGAAYVYYKTFLKN